MAGGKWRGANLRANQQPKRLVDKKRNYAPSTASIHLQARQLDIAQSNMGAKIAKYFPSGKRIIALMA